MNTSPNRRSVCLFGLSADPPTGQQGHLGIVQALQQLNEWDEIWVLPVYRHTYVDKRRRLVSYEHRWNMCQAAFAHLNSPSFTPVVVSDAELQSWKHAVKDITVETEKAKVTVGTAALFDYLRETYSNTEFYFCMGADSFLDLTTGKWNESSRVLEHLQRGRRLLVLHRSASDVGDDEHHALLSRCLEETGARLVRIGHLGSISSTQVRHCQDLEQLSTMVVPRVLDYMRANVLYQFAGASGTSSKLPPGST